MIIQLLSCMVTTMVFLKIIIKQWLQYLEKEITPFESAKLQSVPLFIHIPNSGVGKEMTEVAGQIDVTTNNITSY